MALKRKLCRNILNTAVTSRNWIEGFPIYQAIE